MLNPSTHVITLIAVILDQYGTECLGWEIESLKLALESDYDLTVGTLTVDKLQAGILVLTTDSYNRSFENFTILCNAFNRRLISFENLDPISTEESVWFLVCLKMLLEDDFDGFKLHPEILKYLELLFQTSGVYSQIKGLEFIKTHSPVPDKDVDVDFREAIYKRELNEKTTIFTYVQQNTQELLLQLQEIPLENRSEQANQLLQEFLKQLN